jgi:hypothetical protein
VTSFTYRLHRLATVTGGSIAYPASEARAVLDTYRAVTATAPDELSVQAALFHLPDGSGTRAAGLSMCHCGDDVTRADADLDPLRRAATPLRDTVRRVPYPAMNAQTDIMFPRGALNYWKQAFVDDLSDDLFDVLVDAHDSCPSQAAVLVVEQIHGAATRVREDATAFPYRDEGYAVLLCGQWHDPSATDENLEWTRRTFSALRPHLGRRRYVNYMSADDDDIATAYGSNHWRLVEIKQRYDPTNLFRLNQNIDPNGQSSRRLGHDAARCVPPDMDAPPRHGRG